MFFLPSTHLFDPDLSGADIYGPMVVANDQLVVSIIDRDYGRFAVYRPYNSNEFCQLNINIGIYVTRVGIQSNGSAASNVFFYLGVWMSSGVPIFTGLARVIMNFTSSCPYVVEYKYLNSSDPYDYSLLGVLATGNRIFNWHDTTTFVRDYQILNDSYVAGRPISIDSNFVFYEVDIIFDGWGVIAGAIPVSGIYLPMLYLITFSPSLNVGGYNYIAVAQWIVPLIYPWQKRQARYSSGSNDFDVMYSMSLSINNQGDILFGVQSMNTVYHLYVNPSSPTSFTFKSSRIYSTTVPSIGFGKSVGWFDDTIAVILANNISLDYSYWYSSKIEIYDLSNGQKLNDTQDPYSSFPSIQQPLYSRLSRNIIHMTTSYVGSIIFADSLANVYVILPSPIGYYTATNVGYNLGAKVYISSSTVCAPGTFFQGLSSGKYIFDTCNPCPEGTFMTSSTNSNGTCQPCDTTKYFCPFGAVAKVPLSYMNKVSQAIAYPKSPDVTGFEDILLLNMFNTNFEINCLATTPFFWTLLMTGIGIIFLITMGIIKLTGKCEHYRLKIETVFRHFDIIHEGERWMSGVISITIIVIIIFAGLFTNSFLKQYPQATSHAPDFTCDESLRNSEFLSKMQSLGAAIPTNMKQIFNLLQSQKLTLTITLLNTDTPRNVVVKQIVGSITTQLNPTLSYPDAGCVVISSDLESNLGTINFNISKSYLIGGVRIGLSGPGLVDNKNELQKLNFSNTFSMPSRTLSQQPYFNIELIQVINETKPLSIDGESKYSGLWIPTFTKDDDRNFYTKNEYEIYHSQTYTVLTIEITQAQYYIYNVEKPIIKTSAAIFKNILFISMCMEILAFVFLINKLVIAPLFRLIIGLICSKKEEKEEEEEGSEKEDEEENKSDDDDDGIQTPRKIKLEPGINEWYVPDANT